MTTPPPSPAHAVDRPELRERLNGAVGAPVSLIVAPAGAGKTVLLSQWAASRPDLDFVWLDVERADEDPTRFARRLLDGLAVLAPSAPGLGSMLPAGGAGLGHPLVESLEELLAGHPGTVLIFDDLHNQSNRAILEDLWWLADHLPAGVHIVFSSRVDLRMAWNGHRLRHALVELRQAELAFDEDVTAQVLQRIAGSPATGTTLSSVMDSTEGWAAGVQLTAISLRHQDDAELFAQRLAGTDRLIADYLSEEVLGAQSERRRDLLLRLSALDRMCVSLIESVLGVEDAATLFEELERESMFFVPIDDRHEWFRFHHLFRDLLRYRLRARNPHEETRILLAAADWHEQQRDVASAIEYLLQARAWDRAMDLILTRGREVFERGQTSLVARWLGEVPDADRAARPSAEALYGITLGMSGQAARAGDVMTALSGRSDLDIGLVLIAQAYLSALVQFRPQPAAALHAAREALRMLREHPDVAPPDLMGLTQRPLLRTLALGSRGRGHFLAGDLVEARRWFTRSLDSPGAQYSAYRIHLVGSAALAEAWAGRLEIASALAAEALQLAREVQLLSHPAPADAYLATALVAFHRGRPQSAAFARHEGGVRAASNQRTQLMWVAHLEAVLAGDALGPGMEPAAPPPPIVRDALEAAAQRGRRLAGERGAAGRVSHEWSPVLVESVAQALTVRRAVEARALLDAASFEPRDDLPIAAVEHCILAAWTAHVEGRTSESVRRMSSALETASEHGLVSPFLAAGPEVIRLVEALPAPLSPFARQVLDRAREQLRPVPASGALIEPLTDRERELLAYLPSRLTNAELASRFYVSINTIKTHMAHIYRKLDAANRSAAVDRANELGLL